MEQTIFMLIEHDEIRAFSSKEKILEYYGFYYPGAKNLRLKESSTRRYQLFNHNTSVGHRQMWIIELAIDAVEASPAHDIFNWVR